MMGFNTLQMGKVANDIVSFTNYRDVGFSMDNGHHDGAINAPWSLWRPKLKAWLMMVFGHFLCLLVFWCWLCAVDEGDFEGNEGMASFFQQHLMFFLWLIQLSYFSSFIAIHGCR